MEDTRKLTEEIVALPERDFRNFAYNLLCSIPADRIAELIHENLDEFDMEELIECPW